MGRKQGVRRRGQGASTQRVPEEQGARSKEQGGRAASLLRSLLLTIGAVAGLILGALASAYPFGRHGWQPLGAGLGDIRWVTIARDVEISPPMASDWIVRLRERGVPWPTDLPLKPPGATFGGNERVDVAWFLIRPESRRRELWHIDKPSVRLTDAAGHDTPWEGGSGSVLAVPEKGSQLCYMRLPPEALLRQGLRITFRLATFGNEYSRQVSFQVR